MSTNFRIHPFTYIYMKKPLERSTLPCSTCRANSPKPSNTSLSKAPCPSKPRGLQAIRLSGPICNLLNCRRPYFRTMGKRGSSLLLIAQLLSPTVARTAIRRLLLSFRLTPQREISGAPLAREDILRQNGYVHVPYCGTYAHNTSRYHRQ